MDPSHAELAIEQIARAVVLVQSLILHEGSGDLLQHATVLCRLSHEN